MIFPVDKSTNVADIGDVMATPIEPEPVKVQIRVRPHTRVLLDSIRREKGWTLIEAADRAAKALAATAIEPTPRRKRTAKTAVA
jgi:hypothetical protein